jgi:hypothetical protein
VVQSLTIVHLITYICHCSAVVCCVYIVVVFDCMLLRYSGMCYEVQLSLYRCAVFLLVLVCGCRYGVY